MADQVFQSPAGVGDHQPHAYQAVYLKRKWFDRENNEPTPWVHYPNLWAERVTWCAQPDMPSATLFWRYGLGLTPGNTTFQQYLRLEDIHRAFVKIVMGAEPYRRTWIGTIEMEQHQPWGRGIAEGGTEIPAGEQVLTAYGLEMLLDQAIQMTARLDWHDAINRTKTSRIALPFNAGGKPNQSEGSAAGPGSNATAANPLFNTDNNCLRFWTTQYIVRYLVNSARTALYLPFWLDAANFGPLRPSMPP